MELLIKRKTCEEGRELFLFSIMFHIAASVPYTSLHLGLKIIFPASFRALSSQVLFSKFQNILDNLKLFLGNGDTITFPAFMNGKVDCSSRQYLIL